MKSKLESLFSGNLSQQELEHYLQTILVSCELAELQDWINSFYKVTKTKKALAYSLISTRKESFDLLYQYWSLQRKREETVKEKCKCIHLTIVSNLILYIKSLHPSRFRSLALRALPDDPTVETDSVKPKKKRKRKSSKKGNKKKKQGDDSSEEYEASEIESVNQDDEIFEYEIFKEELNPEECGLNIAKYLDNFLRKDTQQTQDAHEDPLLNNSIPIMDVDEDSSSSLEDEEHGQIDVMDVDDDSSESSATENVPHGLIAYSFKIKRKDRQCLVKWNVSEEMSLALDHILANFRIKGVPVESRTTTTSLLELMINTFNQYQQSLEDEEADAANQESEGMFMEVLTYRSTIITILQVSFEIG